MLIGLGEGVNKDVKDRYRNVMAILKEARMGWVEGDGNAVGHEQLVEYLILREQRKLRPQIKGQGAEKGCTCLRSSVGQEMRLQMSDGRGFEEDGERLEWEWKKGMEGSGKSS